MVSQPIGGQADPSKQEDDLKEGLCQFAKGGSTLFKCSTYIVKMHHLTYKPEVDNIVSSGREICLNWVHYIVIDINI